MFKKEQALTRFSTPKTVDTLSELVPQIINVPLLSVLRKSFPPPPPRYEILRSVRAHTQTHSHIRIIMFQLSFFKCLLAIVLQLDKAMKQ